jgi:hypothetical protein
LKDESVPAGLKLEDRRPDLNRIRLDAEQTETLVPKLEIVNRVLEEQIINRVIADSVFSPQVYLRFEGNVTDVSGSLAPVTVNGTERFVEGRSPGSLAFSFDGVTTLTTRMPNPVTQFTLSAWVKISDGQGGKVFTAPDTNTLFFERTFSPHECADRVKTPEFHSYLLSVRSDACGFSNLCTKSAEWLSCLAEDRQAH